MHCLARGSRGLQVSVITATVEFGY